MLVSLHNSIQILHDSEPCWAIDLRTRKDNEMQGAVNGFAPVEFFLRSPTTLYLWSVPIMISLTVLLEPSP